MMGPRTFGCAEWRELYICGDGLIPGLGLVLVQLELLRCPLGPLGLLGSWQGSALPCTASSGVYSGG